MTKSLMSTYVRIPTHKEIFIGITDGFIFNKTYKRMFSTNKAGQDIRFQDNNDKIISNIGFPDLQTCRTQKSVVVGYATNFLLCD